MREAFEYLGHEVVSFQENAIDYNLLTQYDYDMLLVTGTWPDCPDLKSWLDIVHECAVRGIPTVTLHLDTFWSTKRNGRKWYHENMFHTAFLMTADGDYQKQWRLLGKHHTWLPPAVRHSAAHFGKFKKEYECDVAFVGSNGVGYHETVWPYRKQLVDNLRDTCKRNNWSFKNPGGDDPKIDRGEDMNDFYASAKVTVGDSLCLKKEDSQYWSDRVPEATGRGGFLIMPEIHALKKDFPNIGVYKWGDFKDLEENIRFWLENDKARKLMVEKQQKLTARNNTYVNRARFILKEVGLQ